MTKVLMLGLDGATWDIIKPLVSKGKLPTFKKLMESGAYGRLRSTVPSFTIPAWNSMTTGKNPGKLGIFSFMMREKTRHKFKPYFAGRTKQESNIWDILSGEGKKVIVFNAPNVHTPYRINGHMIAGWLYTSENRLTYPDSLKAEIDSVAAGYEVGVTDIDLYEGKIVWSPTTVEKLITNVNRVMHKRHKVLKFLLEKEWDFFFAVFTAPDRVQHRFWRNNEIVLNLYRRIDGVLRQLLKALEKDVILLIVSDHGFGPQNRIFNINEWLIKEGYLVLKKTSSHPLLMVANLIRKTSVFRFTRSALNYMPRRVAQNIRARSQPVGIEHANIDWKQTKVFAYSPAGGLYINLKGRDFEGVVNPEDYEKLRDELIRKLHNLKDEETGETIEAKVWKREEMYQGENITKMPDLVMQTDGCIHSFGAKIGYNKIFLNYRNRNFGEHRKYGIFLAYGQGIKRGVEIEDARVYDVAPTVLHMFKLPISSDMDGKVLTEIFHKDSDFAKRKIRHAPLNAEKRKIREQIKRLKKTRRI